MMRNRFDRQLAELNQDMIQMGHMIGQANIYLLRNNRITKWYEF